METTEVLYELDDPLIGFDPTYKGWKQLHRPLRLRQFYSFDPTYKGWKPHQLF